jgi:hypothetical protein
MNTLGSVSTQGVTGSGVTATSPTSLPSHGMVPVGDGSF